MYSFKNDYSEGAHPRILETLLRTNLEQSEGYGKDTYCEQAEKLIKDKLNNQEVDVHFISGGTKNGALLGEALVICNKNLQDDFRYNLKQKGAMLAKGRLLGIQFIELFKDVLFFEIGKHENDMVDILREGINNLGYDFFVNSPSNQIFPILNNSVLNELEKYYGFSIWEKIDENRSAIRLVTSFATKKEVCEEFIKVLARIKSNI